LNARPGTVVGDEKMTTTMTLTVLAVLAVLAATARTMSIITDTHKFLERIVNDDQHWAPVLDARVKIDTAVLSPSALALLRGLDAIQPEHDEARRARIMWRPSSSKAPADDAAVVTVNALEVIVEAVTVHFYEGGAMDLAMSVFASVIRCNALLPIAIQVRAVGVIGGRADAAMLMAVLKNLITYVNKVTRLKDPLTAEPELYAKWLTAIGHIGTDDAAAAVDMSAMSRLLQDHLHAACIMDDDGAQDVQEDEAKTTFDAAQAKLDEFVKNIKVDTMDIQIWHYVLAINQVLSMANQSVFGEYDADGPAE